MDRKAVGKDYLRSAHDSYAHRSLPCPLITGVLYIKGEISLDKTTFKVCPYCWPNEGKIDG